MNTFGIHFGYFIKNWHEDPQPYFSVASELGFDLFEIGYDYLLSLTDQELQNLHNKADAANIKLSISMGLPQKADPSSLDASIRKEGLIVLQKTASAMSKANITSCSGIIHGAWNGKLQKYEDKPRHWEHSVRTLKEAVKCFEEFEVNFNVEVVNRFENFLINDCCEANHYLAEVASESLGIHLDTFHMNIEEDSILRAIVKAGSRLKFFHVGENNRKPPGLGKMNWKEIFDSLQIANYRGPISMEPFIDPEGEVGAAISLFRPILHSRIERQEMLKQSLNFVKAIYCESKCLSVNT